MGSDKRPNEVVLKELLNELGYGNNLELNLALLEAIGMLVLCVHWLRGTFNWMMHTEAVKWPSEQDKENYERLFNDIALYETFIWEIAPPRAMLLILREFRQTGNIRENYAVLLNQDPHGRIPFDVDTKTLDDLEDLLRRLGEARVARAKTEDTMLQGKNSIS